MADPRSKSRKTRTLTDEERALWRAVEATVDRRGQGHGKGAGEIGGAPSAHHRRMTVTDVNGRPRIPERPAQASAQTHHQTVSAPRIAADPYYPPQSGKTAQRGSSPGSSSRSSSRASVSAKPGQGAVSAAIDDRTARKILRRQVSIEDRIDLHGLTQAEAHARLERFLHHAHARGLRHVLVITGKGRSSGGILRQMVPLWLREPGMALYASATRTAHISHGGEGALYVRIRRQKRAPKKAGMGGS